MSTRSRPSLLVVEMHHLGDAVMAIPFLRAARKGYDVRVVCRPPVASLLANWVPGIETLEGGWWQAARELRAAKAGAAVCVWADPRAHCLMRISGASIRVGYPMDPENFLAPQIPWRRRRLLAGRFVGWVLQSILRKPLLTHPLSRESGWHQLAAWEALAGPLGFSPDASRPWFAAPACPPAALQFIEAQRSAGCRVVAVHAGGRLPTKRWPHFSKLLERLAGDPSLAAIIIEPPGEQVPEPHGPRQVVLPTPSPDGLAGLLAASDFLVCNDSFAGHVAAALGTPVLAIFGSGDPNWFAPGGDLSSVVASDVCPYRPCVDRCLMPSIRCLESLSDEAVEYRLREALSAG